MKQASSRKSREKERAGNLKGEDCDFDRDEADLEAEFARPVERKAGRINLSFFPTVVSYGPAAMRETFYVYILASTNRHTIYIGITNSLVARIQQHRQQGRGFSAQYHTLRLVYHEVFHDVRDAIARETQIKKWRREKKDWLIGRKNPAWEDLSAEILEELPRIDDPLSPEDMA